MFSLYWSLRLRKNKILGPETYELFSFFVVYRKVAKNHVSLNLGTWFLNKLTGIESSYLMQPNSPISFCVIYKPAKQMLLFVSYN